MGTRQSDPGVGLNAAVAAVLEGERAAADMTLQELADASGVSYRTLQRLLKSRDRHIDVNVLADLADAFNTTPAHVLKSAAERMARSVVTDDEAAEAREAMRSELRRQNPRPARKSSGSGRKVKKSTDSQ